MDADSSVSVNKYVASFVCLLLSYCLAIQDEKVEYI